MSQAAGGTNTSCTDAQSEEVRIWLVSSEGDVAISVAAPSPALAQIRAARAAYNRAETELRSADAMAGARLSRISPGPITPEEFIAFMEAQPDYTAASKAHEIAETHLDTLQRAFLDRPARSVADIAEMFEVLAFDNGWEGERRPVFAGEFARALAGLVKASGH